jgi:hypothetical protein
MTETTDRVTLLVDVLGSEHTDMEMPVQDWRHVDGRLVSDEEAAMIRATPIRDFYTAHHILCAETDIHRQRAKDAERLRELTRPYSDCISIGDVFRLMPPAERSEAEELWRRIEPVFSLWKNGS